MSEFGERSVTERGTGAPPRPPDTTRRPGERAEDQPADRPWRVEGAPGQQPSRPTDWRRFARRWWWLIVIALIVNWIIAAALLNPARTTVSYTFFRQQVQAGNVADITSTADQIEGTFKAPVAYPAGDSNRVTRFVTQRPAFADDALIELLLQKNVTVNANAPDSVPLWQQMLVGFGPTILFIGLMIWFFRRGGGGLGGVGRSRAKLYAPESGPRTTFADVAGIDEVESEVSEVVDFLREPDKYRRLGATIPKGVLLSGPPGTGKTLLARAVAGEANVPFFHMSASEFIEMIVGVGASRVRDLFDSAKKVAPAIIFIDELDAIGRARGATSIGGVDEREQTLNQILTEMDGFTGTEGVVVLAATNRPEILDAALLRPGRFDRRVVVSPPDLVGRRMILDVHTRRVPLDADVDLAALAGSTPGMVGAELRNLVNEAALLAARRGHDAVQRTDFTDALEKVVLGAARQITMTEEEKLRTAFHESGHALLGILTAGADPVRKVSIVPRGHALGVTLQSPESDRYSHSERYLRGRIVGLLGGRAAEDVVYGEVTTGSESDLEQVSRLARQMVGRWGMSDKVGPLTVLPVEGQESYGLDGSGPSPATRELVDSEARQIVDRCYAEAVATLRDHQEQLELLAHTLFEHETLDTEQVYAAVGMER